MSGIRSSELTTPDKYHETPFPTLPVFNQSASEMTLSTTPSEETMYGKPELSDTSGSEFSGDIVHTTVCSPHVDLSTIHLQAEPAVDPEHAPGVEVTEAWVEDEPSDPDAATVTDKKTRSGRAVKPPVRYEPTEQVEDDTSCDDDDGGEGEGDYSDEESEEEEDEYESDFVCGDEDLEYESEDEEDDEDEYDTSDDDLDSDCSDDDVMTEDEEEEEEDETHKRKKTKLAKKVMRSADGILANISAEEKNKLLKMLTGSA